MPNQPRTPLRSVRIDTPEWADAGVAAKAMGTDRAKIINEFLRWYIGRPGAKLPERPLAGGSARASAEPRSVDPWDIVNTVVRDIASGRVGPGTDLHAAAEAAAQMLRALGIAPAAPGDSA